MQKIRFAKPQEKEILKQLWQDSFFDKDPFLSFWFDNVFDAKKAVVAESDGEISGALHMIPYTLNKHEKVYSLMYICGFSVRAGRRGTGIGTEILKFAHRYAKEQNVDFAVLISDADGYYERFSYFPVSERVKYEIDLNDIVDVPNSVSMAKTAEGLDEIYKNYASRFDMFLNKSIKPSFDEYALYPGGTCVLEDRAYAIFTAEKDIEIFEAAYTEKSELLQLLSFLKSRYKEAEKLILHTAVDDIAKTVFYGGRVKKIIEKGIMAKALGEASTDIFGFSGGEASLINIF